MEIKVLGASGSEVPGHSCPAFLVDGKILLDAGTIANSLHISEEQTLRHILLTHAHFDHIKGLPFLLDNLVIRDSGHTITVAGGRDVLDDLQANIFNDRIWPDFTRIPSAGKPVLRYRALRTDRPALFDGYRVTMTRVDHTVPAYGFIVADPGGDAVAYTGDTGPTDRFWKRVDRAGVKCLIVECSYPDRMRALALSAKHLTPSLLARELARLSSPPPEICVVHLKPQLLPEIERELLALGIGALRLPAEGETLRL
jgi:ribonuclease BN (tRNA processing enzyme)